MSGKTFSSAEIEQKRLQALARLKSKGKEQTEIQKKIEENRLAAIERRKKQISQIPAIKAQDPVTIRIELKTFNTFEIYVKGTSNKLFEVFKSIPSHRYSKSHMNE